MKIEEILKSKKRVISFEFFPPKSEIGEIDLFENVKKLKKISPDFVSVTYGAGGSTREKTNEMAVKLSKNEDINVMIHLTSILHKKDDIERMLSNYCEEGIENILALRGDAPKGEIVDYKNQELPYAEELIKFINEKFSSKFSIGGAAFPEGHPESKNIDEEMYYFKRKCEAGMKFAITQLFFDNNKYFNYMERCKKNNIEIDIIPGIMPITAYFQIDKFIAMCKVEIPLKLREKLEKYKDNKDAVEEIGVEFATKQCMILLENGVKGIHFYTLNKSKATQKIYENIKNMI